MRRKILYGTEAGFRVVMVDEMMVTKSTLPTHDWTRPNTNHELDLSQIDTRAIAVVGAVSRERGVELIMTFRKSVDMVKFRTFLEELRRLNPFDDMMLVLDNLQVHKSEEMKMRMDELGFEYAWTPPYSPQYNGIEEVWA